MPKAKWADVNGQHVFYGVHAAGKPLVLLVGKLDAAIACINTANAV